MLNYLTTVDVAGCLGISASEAEKILRSSNLRSRRVSGETRYERLELLNWLGLRFGTLALDKLRDADLSGGTDTGLDPATPFVREFLEKGGIHAWVNANTSASLIRKLASFACKTGKVFDSHLLTELLSEREKVSSTALPAGVAFPHPVDSRKLYMEDNLLLLARTYHPIPFGESSGRLTSLFFLMLFNDPGMHLHVLARLNRIVRTRGLVDNLTRVDDSGQMLELLSEVEETLLSA